MTAHLTDVELRAFVAGRLDAVELLRADDHLAGCEACRVRAMALTDAGARVDDFRAGLADAHVSDDDLQQLVRGELGDPVRVAIERHLRVCATCAAQVDDLRAWIAGPVRRTGWLALAAAVAVAALVPAIAHYARSRPDATASRLEAVASLDPADQARVRDALASGAAVVPSILADLNPPRETLMGPGSGSSAPGGLRLIAPVGTATASDTPRFEWQAPASGATYVVTIVDEQSAVVARSPTIAESTWTPRQPLPRGRTYVWQVTAERRDGVTVTVPAAPAPPAKFHVVDAKSAAMLERAEAAQPASHVVLGILAMEAGIADEAARQFELVPPGDPHADVARRSLERLRAVRSSR